MLEGVAIGLALTTVVGVLTFVAHHKLPYKKMLVLTGALIGFVLVVMVGESMQELQLAGWIPTTNLGFTLPGWMGLWLAIFPTVETLAAQALAAGAVIGSYLLAEHVRVRGRSARRAAARRPEQAPARGRSRSKEGLGAGPASCCPGPRPKPAAAARQRPCRFDIHSTQSVSTRTGPKKIGRSTSTWPMCAKGIMRASPPRRGRGCGAASCAQDVSAERSPAVVSRRRRPRPSATSHRATMASSSR